MLLIYKAQASMCLSGLKSWLLKSRIYTILNRSAALTCYFRKWAVEEFSIFYFSHQRKAAIIVQQPSPGGENPPCCAEPSSPPRQTRVAAVTEGTSGSTATVRWIGVCFWAVWSDVPEVGIWVGFFCLVEIHRVGRFEHHYPLRWVCLPWTRDVSWPPALHLERAAAKSPQLLSLPLSSRGNMAQLREHLNSEV